VRAVFPVIIFVVVAVPILVLAVAAARRRNDAGEHPAGEDDARRMLVEKEFENSERFQEEWRKEHHGDLRDERLP
jgi:hypothetical protein